MTRSNDERNAAAAALRAVDSTDLGLAIRRGDETSPFLRSRLAAMTFSGAIPIAVGLTQIDVWFGVLGLALLLAVALTEHRRFIRASGLRMSPKRRAALRGDRTPARLRRSWTVASVVGLGAAMVASEVHPAWWLGLVAAPFCAAFGGIAWDREWRRRASVMA